MSLGVLLTLLPTFGVKAQLCGKSFAKFVVVDSESKSVSDVTIELIAELPAEVYLEFKAEEQYEEYGDFSFKLAPQNVEQLLKRAVPLPMSTDLCGNPFKQRANSTPVKNLQDSRKGHAASVTNFGFCASEGNRAVTLLRISAPGYVTDYYVGSYLRGCIYHYSFVLTRLPKTKNSTGIRDVPSPGSKN